VEAVASLMGGVHHEANRNREGGCSCAFSLQYMIRNTEVSPSSKMSVVTNSASPQVNRR